MPVAVGGASQECKAGPLPPPAYPMEAPYLDDNGEVIEDGASPVGKMKEGALVDVSHLISQKMLQGWALLDKACEIGCGGDTPLLRDPKTRQEYCVICGYLDEDGAAVVQAAKTVPATGSGERCDSSSDDEDSVDSDRALAAYADKRVRDILSASAASAAAPRQSPDRTTGRLPEDIAVAALDEVFV
ncbi:unnamed protein product [Symbiodinium microadriaticum]|nr:unnamed protein product [Symbiodinium microadriaticum]